MSKAEKTKEFIIEKSAPIFNKKGYAGTSLADIMEATNLTKGSIYGNFENKDELYEPVLEKYYLLVIIPAILITVGMVIWKKKKR